MLLGRDNSRRLSITDDPDPGIEAAIVVFWCISAGVISHAFFSITRVYIPSVLNPISF